MLTLKLGLNMCELFSMFILINKLYLGVKFNLEKIRWNFWIFFIFFRVLIFYPVEKSNCSFNPCPTWPHFIYFCRLSLCSRHLFVLFESFTSTVFLLSFISSCLLNVFQLSFCFLFVSVCLSVSFSSLSVILSLSLSIF